MKIAFYAPMKPPDHPLPSGDRAIGRGLMDALGAGGHDVVLASRLRSLDRRGDARRQARLAAIGGRIAARLAARWCDASPDVWFTYHLHHKAPDWLGPAVARALGVPYVVAEASIAARQRDGPWAAGYAQALAGIRAAETIVFLNPADEPGVREVRGHDAPDERLAPFIDVAAFAGATPDSGAGSGRRDGPLRLVTVAMMREGAKLASYRILAAALATIADVDWRLEVVGDGPARAAVEALFAGMRERVSFRGALGASRVAGALAGRDLFVWPAVDEAIGMACLEAQACGVPVVAGAMPGVAATVEAERTGLLVPPGDAAAFAAAVRRLAGDQGQRVQMGRAAALHAREHHDVAAAAQRLTAILGEAVGRQRARAATAGGAQAAAVKC